MLLVMLLLVFFNSPVKLELFEYKSLWVVVFFFFIIFIVHHCKGLQLLWLTYSVCMFFLYLSHSLQHNVLVLHQVLMHIRKFTKGGVWIDPIMHPASHSISSIVSIALGCWCAENRLFTKLANRGPKMHPSCKSWIRSLTKVFSE